VMLHLLWRFFFFESGRAGMNVELALSAYQNAPLRVVFKRALELLIDIFEGTVSAWVVPLNSITFALEPRDLIAGSVLCSLAIGIFAAYFFATSNKKLTELYGSEHQQHSHEMFLIGAAAVLFSLIPVIAVGRDIRWESGFDKYTLQASAGVAMLIVGAISWLGESRLKFIPFALLITIAIATQYGNSYQWAEFWEDQRELWWQLSWRAPQLKEGTVLLIETPGQRFYEDYEIWGPANLVYDPDGDSVRIRSEVFIQQTLEKIRVGQTETRGLRETLEFSRSFLNSLIVTRPERTSCWHILDGNDPVFPDQTSAMLYAVVSLSNINQIETDAPPNSPPTHIFGAEPQHNWCYFFQRASLEAQRENWEEVAALTDQALDAGYKPIDRSEWLPFLKGLVMVGRTETAEEMALWIRDIGTIRHRQCDYLSDTALPDPARRAYLREILCE
jgi:hypothetical protein